MDTYELLVSAIRNKHWLTATYQGRHREFCPHVIGRGPRGNRQVPGLQFAGESESVLPPGGQWRCFDVDCLRDVEVRSGIWLTQERLQPQTCVQYIDVDVGQ